MKFAQKILMKLAVFYRLFFSEVSPEKFYEIPVKPANFSASLSLKILQNLTFFSATYQKLCIVRSLTRVCIRSSQQRLLNLTNVNIKGDACMSDN